MINLDTIIKIGRSRIKEGLIQRTDWPEYTRFVLGRLDDIKQGFPGLGGEDLTFLEWDQVQDGEMIIFDSRVEEYPDDWSCPILGRVLERKEKQLRIYIEGIGKGYNMSDPERKIFRWGQEAIIPEPHPRSLMLRVDSRPTQNGGPGYYYFFKAVRDQRW